MTDSLQFDKFWVDKTTYSDAEKQYYEGLAKLPDSKGLLSFSNSVDGSNPEELQSPKSFVAIKKISISECETNKENISVSSPETPKSNIKKIKSQKCVLSKDESEWITVCSKSELKEKNSKKNKKGKDRVVEATPSPVIVNKEPTPPPSPKDEVVTVVQQQPVDTPAKSPKTKEVKEKMSKAERKRCNKKEKAEVKEEKPQIIEKVEEVVQAVEKIVDIQGESATQIVSGQCSLSREIAKARQHIKNSLECMDTVMASVPSVEISNRLNTLESAMNDLRKLVLKVQEDVASLKNHIPAAGKPATSASPAKPPQAKPVAPAPSKEDSDDGVDLFASDSEDDEAAAKIREERLAAYAAKKSKKPVLIAKSSIILDVKPWDDETDMNEMERLVRKIATDGLLWGASKFVLLAYGIKKLQINCIVEDEKVSIDWLQEEIEKLEDLVQSVDIAAFNKI